MAGHVGYMCVLNFVSGALERQLGTQVMFMNYIYWCIYQCSGIGTVTIGVENVANVIYGPLVMA